ncbi:MAG: GH25 family lysozyme [Clostridia bacterium]|nr:GH25 family lysozyme [Clostridia bacterium]
MKTNFKKTLLSVLLVLVMVFGTISVIAYADSSWGPGTYKVTTGISMRSTPEVPAVDPSSNKIGSVTKDATVIVTEIQDGWGHTSFKDLTGWVSMDYLEFVSFDMSVPISNYYVNCDVLNIRSQVNLNSTVRGTADYGTVVTVNRTRQDGWVNITVDGVTGWVMKKYLIQRYESDMDKNVTFSSCVTKSNANLRTGPDKVYNTRMVIPEGSELVISKILDGFAFTSFENTLGWVSLELLDYKSTNELQTFHPFTRSIMFTAGDGAVYAKGIDISKWNGTDIDWPLLKESGIDFIIMRLGTTKGIDSSFETYYEAAKAVGIDVGGYFYTYSTTVKGAKEDAQLCLQWLKGKQMEYPIYFDIEDPTLINLSKTTCTNMCTTFCDTMLDGGWYPGVYTMADWWSSKLDYNALGTKYESWIARVNSKTVSSQCSPSGSYDYASQFGMYQWNWCGRITAISGGKTDVDLDVVYKDYPSIIKDMKLNGYDGTPSRNLFVKKNYGDADNNEKINMSDVVYMQKAVAKLVELSGAEMVLADVNCDEAVTMDDVVSVQQYIANLKKAFAVG